MMVDLLTGQLGDEGQQEASSKVVQVLIAGNLLSKKTQDKDNLMKVILVTLCDIVYALLFIAT